MDSLKKILGKKLYGVYIYGAAAFPDKLPTGDIDFHVILTRSLTENEKLQLEKLHESIAQRFPPLGGELDGYYILLKDTVKKVPPKSQMWKRATDTSWALHREHILAGRCIVFYGPDPKEIYQPAEWSEIETALYGELDFVEKNLQNYPDYCILNLCRLIYSFETKDVVISKDKASEWAIKALPQWKELIKLARKSYEHRASQKDKEFMSSEVGKFLEFAKKRVQSQTKE